MRGKSLKIAGGLALAAIVINLLATSVLFPSLSQAYALSLGPGYLKPSNYELVRDTEAIVLAKAKATFSSPAKGKALAARQNTENTTPDHGSQWHHIGQLNRIGNR